MERDSSEKRESVLESLDRRIQKNLESTKRTSIDFTNPNGARVFLHQIEKYPLLTKEEEIELSKLIQKGKAAEKRKEGQGKWSDEDESNYEKAVKARDLMIMCNQRLVIHNAKDYFAKGILEFEDLIQEAQLGLIKAVENFDREKGFDFPHTQPGGSGNR